MSNKFTTADGVEIESGAKVFVADCTTFTITEATFNRQFVGGDRYVNVDCGLESLCYYWSVYFNREAAVRRLCGYAKHQINDAEKNIASAQAFLRSNQTPAIFNPNEMSDAELAA